MTVQAALFPLTAQLLFGQNACPIAGGNLYFYDAETTNARAVYKDAALQNPHQTPVKTDAFGRIPTIYIGTGSYKVVLKDQFNSTLTTIDDLVGGVDIEPPAVLSNYWVTGDLKSAYSDAIQDGFVVANGKTIGNANSQGSARANDDCKPLFTLLWNTNPNLVVSGGRGQSADADWAGAKTIATPNACGRVFCGVDQMGADSTAGVITTASTPTPNQIGATFGSQTVSMTVDQLPTFTPQVTINAAGGFTPSGTIASAGAHTHTGSTTSNGDHNHQINYNSIGGGGGGNAILFGSGLAPTQNAGAHAHSLNVDSNGAHIHSFTGTAQPDHTHTATALAIGSGNGHGNMQPAMLVYFHIKL